MDILYELLTLQKIKNLKILLVNTSERVGGAAIAASRLMSALKHSGARCSMLVRDRQSEMISVTSIRSSWMLTVKFLWERMVIWVNNALRRRNIWQVDIANTGTDITCLPEFKSADVVHLHWVNQGFLSLNNIEAILRSDKHIVVTMHDMWYFTGICHYAGNCDRYEKGCFHCPLLTRGGVFTDLAKKVWERKAEMYKDANITFVGCSQWMANMAQRSALARNHKVVSIPNAIDTELFAPHDKTEARKKLHLPLDKTLLLFTCQRITDPRKGFSLLVEAIKALLRQQPQLKDKLTIVVVGGDSSKAQDLLPLPVRMVNYLHDEQSMVGLYNAADIYVTPSLQDNLPNTIVEAMACGLPCVGFNVGGIPEMIDHEVNGYVAEYRNSEDFARGILWTIDPERHDKLSVEARSKAEETYSEQHIAHLYNNIYARQD